MGFYIVGFGDLFEFGFGFFFVVRVFIGVPLHSELSIRFFEVIVFGVSVYLENLVVIDAHAFFGFLFFFGFFLFFPGSDFFVVAVVLFYL